MIGLSCFVIDVPKNRKKTFKTLNHIFSVTLATSTKLFPSVSSIIASCNLNGKNLQRNFKKLDRFKPVGGTSRDSRRWSTSGTVAPVLRGSSVVVVPAPAAVSVATAAFVTVIPEKILLGPLKRSREGIRKMKHFLNPFSKKKNVLSNLANVKIALSPYDSHNSEQFKVNR